ncbi:MAG: cysteine desulfurase/selenocysteine lyase [Myxococcota bacterium]|jgi:cysteine desulfurase/selenocysteine lyase
MSAAVQTAGGFDVQAVRALFPGLHQEVNGRPLVYLDSGASAQKVQPMLDALMQAYTVDCANVHRGVHKLSQRATDAYEKARTQCQRFLNAAHDDEIVFTKGTTDALNLVAYTFGREVLKNGGNVVVTHLEHHANIVPWQLMGAEIHVVPVADDGSVSMADFEHLIDSETRMVSVAHVSNALGTILPVKEIIDLAHSRGVPVMIDGAQGVVHQPVDVQALGADFYCFSGHKVFGPTGIGVLYGRRELLAAMPPWLGGGDMIKSVSFDGSTYADPPSRFEAGTPNIAGAIGLGAAVEWMMSLDWDAVLAHEADLLEYGTRQLEAIEGLRMVGTAPHKAGVLSFVIEGIHPHDIGTIVDMDGVAVRVGHHCAQPIMERFGLTATTRASFALYNTRDDIDALVSALGKVKKIFG